MFNNEYEIFKELNSELEKARIELTVICAGGFVLSHYGMRATQDIDGFFKSTHEIERIIKRVGDKYGINKEDELWLNNSVQNLNPQPPEELCDQLYSFNNLNVLMLPLDYIAGMKLKSAREIDIKDVGEIIKKLEIQSPEGLSEKLNSYGFSNIDKSNLLEAFGCAYGMDWLEEYYIQHEKEILKSMGLEYKFNEETIEAIEEGRAILEGKIESKRYKNLDEVLKEIEDEI